MCTSLQWRDLSKHSQAGFNVYLLSCLEDKQCYTRTKRRLFSFMLWSLTIATARMKINISQTKNRKHISYCWKEIHIQITVVSVLTCCFFFMSSDDRWIPDIADTSLAIFSQAAFLLLVTVLVSQNHLTFFSSFTRLFSDFFSKIKYISSPENSLFIVMILDKQRRSLYFSHGPLWMLKGNPK